MEPPVALAALPMPMHWGVTPARCSTDGSSRLKIMAQAETDMFVDPAGTGVVLSAPRLLGTPPDGPYQLSARVTVDFAETFDAGVLLVWADQTRWAKLCFEYSPAGQPMIVSVVTRDVSDDANGFVVSGRTVWLRVSRFDRAFAFHASLDGAQWSFVRYFDLGGGPTQVGLEAQSPMGKGCAVEFTDLRYRPELLADLRDGS